MSNKHDYTKLMTVKIGKNMDMIRYAIIYISMVGLPMLQFDFYTFLRTHLEPQTGSFSMERNGW